MRDAAVGRIVDDHLVAVAGDDFEGQRRDIERNPLGATREQHLFARDQPQLLFGGRIPGGERAKHIVIVDDAILENLDETRAFVGMRGL